MFNITLWAYSSKKSRGLRQDSHIFSTIEVKDYRFGAFWPMLSEAAWPGPSPGVSRQGRGERNDGDRGGGGEGAGSSGDLGVGR